MHLHGVYTSEWGGDLKAQYPGEAVLCRDACPLWDGLAGAKTREGLSPGRADGAIVVYPETLIGDPYKRSVSCIGVVFFFSFLDLGEGPPSRRPCAKNQPRSHL